MLTWKELHQPNLVPSLGTENELLLSPGLTCGPNTDTQNDSWICSWNHFKELKSTNKVRSPEPPPPQSCREPRMDEAWRELDNIHHACPICAENVLLLFSQKSKWTLTEVIKEAEHQTFTHLFLTFIFCGLSKALLSSTLRHVQKSPIFTLVRNISGDFPNGNSRNEAVSQLPSILVFI